LNRYNNYHKHTHISNIFTPDTPFKAEDYCKRAVELGDTTYFTTEHGSGGDIFEAKTLCEKYKLKCIFGMEGYIVPNPLEKDNSNYHIMLIANTNKGRREINKASSHANKNGYYYKPRLFLEDLLKMDKNDVFITTACAGGLFKDEVSENKIVLPLIEHFQESLFLELQSHNNDLQKRINLKALEFQNKYGLKLISANDSHYIYPEQAIDRTLFLQGKHINYPEEESFVLDYPNFDTLYKRYQNQGLLSESDIVDAINNTLIFDNCEEIDINKVPKMPTIYPNLSDDEKELKLKNIVYSNFEQIIKDDSITEDSLEKYKNEIESNLKVIHETSKVHTSDYFLLNTEIVEKATTKYHGILTRTSRGSSAGFYLNRVLGMTQMDKMTTSLPLYADRFMSTARVLENNSFPDIDYNVVSQQPFFDATRELLGETGCYPMSAYGTMQEAEAFRNLCRSKDIDYEEFNIVAKNLDAYKNDKKWKNLIIESEKMVNVIVSASVHPCAFVLSNDDIESELGIIKIGDALCCMITSDEADEWKYLKNDYLIVSVWDIISQVFERINKPIMSINELRSKLDDKTWEIYEKGLTCTINQLDSDWGTQLAIKYKPKTIDEIAKLVAAIRPSFNPWRDKFINRGTYTNGTKQLDDLFQYTDHYLLFQENIMQYFDWLGITPSESIGLIKKISKKKIKQEHFDKLEETLSENWIKNTGSIDNFKNVWDMVQSCMAYGFNAPHGLAYAYDSLYGAYLKSHYPNEYYSVVLNIYQDDEDRTAKLTKELEYFKINLEEPKFRYAKSEYFFEESTHSIYKGMKSIKFVSQNCADDLYNLKEFPYNSFTDLLYDIKNTSVNSRQLNILIRLDFFSEFGNSKELLRIADKFDYFKQGDSKMIKKEKIINDNILTSIVNRNSVSTEISKSYTKLNCYKILKECEEYLRCQNIEDFSVKDKLLTQLEFLGYINICTHSQDEKERRKLVILEIRPIADRFSKTKGKVWKYAIKTQSIGSGKHGSFYVPSGLFDKDPISQYDIIFAEKVFQEKGYWNIGAYHHI